MLHSKVALLTFALLFPSFVRAQSNSDTIRYATGNTYAITKKNGEQLRGTITSFDNNQILANVKNVGIVIVNRSDIKQTVLIEPRHHVEALVYGHAGAGLGIRSSLRFGFSIVKEHTIVDFSGIYAECNDPNAPSNFRINPYVNGLAPPPHQFFMMGAASVGWIGREKSSGQRFNLLGGLLFGTVSTPDYKYDAYWAVYHLNYDPKLTLGFSINPKVDWVLSQDLGFSLGVLAGVSGLGKFCTLEGSMLIGKLKPHQAASVKTAL